MPRRGSTVAIKSYFNDGSISCKKNHKALTTKISDLNSRIERKYTFSMCEKQEKPNELRIKIQIKPRKSHPEMFMANPIALFFFVADKAKQNRTEQKKYRNNTIAR